MFVDTLNLIVHVHNNNYKQIKRCNSVMYTRVYTRVHSIKFDLAIIYRYLSAICFLVILNNLYTLRVSVWYIGTHYIVHTGVQMHALLPPDCTTRF